MKILAIDKYEEPVVKEIENNIIVMHLPNGDRYFYVDMFGFKEIKFDKNGKMMAAEKEVVKYKRLMPRQNML